MEAPVSLYRDTLLVLYEEINMNTRKDFQATADLIRTTGWPASVKMQVAKDFAKKYEAENPRFDDEKFYIACGVW